MITILFITFHVSVQLVFPGVIPGWAGSGVVTTIDLSPPPRWLATTKPTLPPVSAEVEGWLPEQWSTIATRCLASKPSPRREGRA